MLVDEQATFGKETTDSLDVSLSDLLVVGQLVEELADVADAAQRRGVQVGQDLDQDLRRQPEDQETRLTRYLC